MKDLKYYKDNCEEDYLHTPISVLRYITELEKITETKPLIIDSVVESALTPEDLTIFAKWVDEHFYTHRLKILPRELEKFYIENRESIVKQYS
jgi:hypothetical protein